MRSSTVFRAVARRHGVALHAALRRGRTVSAFDCSDAGAQICEAYGANRYPFPEDPARRRQMMAEVTMRLRELHTTIEAGAQPFRSGTWRLK